MDCARRWRSSLFYDERKKMSCVAVPRVPLYQMGALQLRRQLSGESNDWKEFEEQVTRVYGNGRYKIKLRSLSGVVRAPSVPLYQMGTLGWHQYLGQAGPQAVAAGGSIAAASVPAIASMAPGLIAVSAIPVVGAAIAVVAAIIAGLWAAHDKRVAGAKAENQAINSAVQTFDAALKAIFAAANSSDATQNITAAEAQSLLPPLLQTFWQKMAPFTTAAGAADASHGGQSCGTPQPNPGQPSICTATTGATMVGGHACNKDCTATCCVGCNDLVPTIAEAMAIFQNPAGGTMWVCTVYGSKYGATLRSAYQLTYTPPTVTAAATASGVASTAAGAVTAAETAAAAAGLPSWLPLAAGAALLFLLMK
jgi:hypothetical protein